MKIDKRKFEKGAYIVLSIAVGILLLVAAVASLTGDNSIFTGDQKSLWSSWFPIVLFGVYALVQIICLARYKFGFTVYKIGFALLHIGLLVMLVGFLAGAIAGEQSYFNLMTDSYYDGYYDADRNYQSLGFGIQITDFTVEKYESGADKFYHADVYITDTSTGRREEKSLEVNHTIRAKGWKIYLMSYSDGKSVGELANRELDRSFECENWSDLSARLSQNYQDGAELSYRCYNLNSGAYIETTPEALSHSATMPLYGHVVEEAGKRTVYIYPEQQLLLFKRDPGEFAVIAGMVMVFVGVVMTCLIKKKKSSSESGDRMSKNSERKAGSV